MKLKISRLFHWLYATLMFLPILMFLPSCLYFAFNEHATNTETTTLNYKYQSNEVNDVIDFVEGNIYSFNYDNETITYNNDIVLKLVNGRINFVATNLTEGDTNSFEITDNITFEFFTEVGVGITFYLCNDDFSINTVYEIDEIHIHANVLYLTYYEDFDNEMLSYLNYTDYNVIESVTTNVEQTIPQQINNAWNSVWNLPVFSWTQNSFITAPFSYITALFGLSSDNTLNYVFTYFASISICWLVFDLIMYVPNLAHRWLDRSAIE